MENQIKYEVALSFAGEDRSYVEKVAKYLYDRGIEVFYDEFNLVDMWGKNLFEYFDEVYRKNSRHVVMFVSKYYVSKAWTNHERRAMQAKSLEAPEYILPARFDDSEVPGLFPTTGYIDLRKHEPEKLGEIIMERLGHNITKKIERFKTLRENLVDTVPGFTLSPSIVDGKTIINVSSTDGSQIPIGVTTVASASGALEEYYMKGAPLQLGPHDIETMMVPAALAPILNRDNIKQIIVESRIDPTVSMKVRLEFVNAFGKISTISDITLRPRRVGMLEATLDNSGDDSPIKVTAVPRFDSPAMTLSLEYRNRGSVKKNLECLRFFVRMADGGRLRVVYEENDVEFSGSDIPAGTFQKPDDGFIATLEKLMEIQRVGSVVFDLPVSFSSDEIDTIHKVYQIMTTGIEEVEEAALTIYPYRESIVEMLKKNPPNQPIKLGAHGNGAKALLFGKEIDLGESFLKMESVDFKNGREEVERLLASSQDEIDVILKQIPGSRAAQYFFKYYKGDDLSKEGVLPLNQPSQ